MSGTSNRLSPRWLMQEMAFSIVEFLVRATSRRYSARVPIERIRQHLATDSRFRSTQEIQPIITNLLEYGWIAREYNQEESAKHAVLFWATTQANPKSESEWASVKSFPDLRSRTVYPDLYADQQGVESPGLLRIRILRGDGPEFSEPPESTAVPAQEVPPPTVKTDTAESPECKFKDAQSNPIKIYNLRPGILLDPTPLKDIGVRVPSQVARNVRNHMMEQFIMMNPGVSIDTAVLQAEEFGCRPFLARRSIQDLVNTRRVNLDGAFLWPVDKHESRAASATKTHARENTRVSPHKEDQEGGEHGHGQEDGSPSGQAGSSPVGSPRIDTATSGGDLLQKESLLLADRISRLPLNDRAVVLMIIARLEQ